MADTGWLSPSAEGETYSDWNNPTRIYSSNNSRATAGTGSTIDQQDCYNFTIPDLGGNAIDGIEVSVEAGNWGFWLTTWTMECKLSWDGGTSWTSAKSQSWNNFWSDLYKSYGGAADTWGRGWSASAFTDGNFRVFFDVTGGRSTASFGIDHVRLKVFYTAGTTTSSSTSSTSSSSSSSSSSTSTTSSSSSSTSSSSSSSSTSSTSSSTSSTSTSSTSSSTSSTSSSSSSSSTSSTSSSTSSTSTSSTSSSTSSTSTSSTSTSISTSTSVTATSTSTSSTSTTSTSTSSTSSSSSSSTSTTTIMFSPNVDLEDKGVFGGEVILA